MASWSWKWIKSFWATDIAKQQLRERIHKLRSNKSRFIRRLVRKQKQDGNTVMIVELPKNSNKFEIMYGIQYDADKCTGYQLLMSLFDEHHRYLCIAGTAATQLQNNKYYQTDLATYIEIDAGELLLLFYPSIPQQIMY